jgi:hypothetical protein
VQVQQEHVGNRMPKKGLTVLDLDCVDGIATRVQVISVQNSVDDDRSRTRTREMLCCVPLRASLL